MSTWDFRPTGARSGTSRAGRIRCCTCGACRRTFHLRDGFRGTFRSPYGAFRRGRPQISPRAARCAGPTDLIRLAALGTCPYPFCPFGTFPPDRGNRPKGEGTGGSRTRPYGGKINLTRWFGKVRRGTETATIEIFLLPRAQWPGGNLDRPLRFCAPEIFARPKG